MRHWLVRYATWQECIEAGCTEEQTIEYLKACPPAHVEIEDEDTGQRERVTTGQLNMHVLTNLAQDGGMMQGQVVTVEEA